MSEKIEKLKITSEEKEAIIKNSPKQLPLTPNAQGWSQQAIRHQLYASICAEENSLLALISKRFNEIALILQENESSLEEKLNKISKDNLTFIANEENDNIVKILFEGENNNKISLSFEEVGTYLDLDFFINNKYIKSINFEYNQEKNKTEIKLNDGVVLNNIEIEQLIDGVKKEIKKLLDLKAPLVHNHDEQYYTKQQIDERVKNYITAEDFYNKEEIENKLSKKAELNETYRKEEVDSFLLSKVNVEKVFDKEKILTLFKESEIKLKEYISNKINELIGEAPDTLDTLKEIADFIKDNKNKISEIIDGLRDKVDKNEVYLKNQIDNLLKQKVGKTTFNNKIQEIESNILNKLNIVDFNTKIEELKNEINTNIETKIKSIALKVIQEELENKLKNYYQKSDTYSREEIDNKIITFQNELIVLSPEKFNKKIEEIKEQIRQDIQALESRIQNSFREKNDNVFENIELTNGNVFNKEKLIIGSQEFKIELFIDKNTKEMGLLFKNELNSFKLFLDNNNKIIFKALEEKLLNLEFDSLISIVLPPNALMNTNINGEMGLSRVASEHYVNEKTNQKADIDDVYNKTKINLLLNAKSDKDFTYTKQETLKKLNEFETKLKQFVNGRIEELVGTAPENLDTLKEIADYIKGNKDKIEEVLNGLVEKISKQEFNAYKEKVRQELIGKQDKITNEIVLGNKYKAAKIEDKLIIFDINTNLELMVIDSFSKITNFKSALRVYDERVATENYVQSLINPINENILALLGIDHSVFRKKNDNTFTSDIILKSENGDSPKIYLQRGTIDDSFTDYQIYVSGGNLKIDKVSGNSTTNMITLYENGNATYKGNEIITSNRLKKVNGNNLIGIGNIKIGEKPFYKCSEVVVSLNNTSYVYDFENTPVDFSKALEILFIPDMEDEYVLRRSDLYSSLKIVLIPPMDNSFIRFDLIYFEQGIFYKNIYAGFLYKNDNYENKKIEIRLNLLEIGVNYRYIGEVAEERKLRYTAYIRNIEVE